MRLSALVVVAYILAAGRNALCFGNLLLNGDFSKGSGASVDQWRTESWNQAPAYTRYGWTHPAKGGGEISVENMKPNDARYLQNLTLAPGWYRFSVMARTQGVGVGAVGATLSIMEDGVASADLRGTQNWQRLRFYLKVGPRGSDVEVGCRLGGYSSLNTGDAFFRDAEAIQVASPGDDGPRFDLDSIRKAANGAPIGHLWSLVATLMLLAGVVAFGWMSFPLTSAPRVFGADARVPPIEGLSPQRPGKSSSPAAARNKSARRR
ncbi:MAG TPA: hypothetical protein VGI47_09085 [Candidatus Binataceae bacterium]